MAVAPILQAPENDITAYPNVRHPKIGLLDHMGFGNMGDAAIHESFVQNIKKRLPGADLVAFSQNPEDTRSRHGIVSYPIRSNYFGSFGSDEDHISSSHSKRHLAATKYLPKRSRRVLRELAFLRTSYAVVRSLDLLVLSGGGQLCDLWWDQPYNVWKFCVLARLANTPIFFLGVGADLIRAKSSKFFAMWAVRLANYASFRDAESQVLIRRLGVKRETHVCPDPAYGLEIGNAQLARSSKTRLKIGLNPMGFCDPRTWPRQDPSAYNSYIDKLALFSSWLLRQSYDLELFSSDIGIDRYAIEDLKSRIMDSCPSQLSDRITYHVCGNLQQLLLQMSGFDFVVTCKFHGVVFSHLLARPVIALSYLPKIEYLMQNAGHDQYCLDIEHFDVNVLIKRFETLIDNADDLTSLFKNVTVNYRQQLQVEFDTLCRPWLSM
jgi:polysaccharide pyruvyl transferase WcaK-like protein